MSTIQAHFSAQVTHRWSDEWELAQIAFAGDNSNTQSTDSIWRICTQHLDVLLTLPSASKNIFISREYILYVLDFTFYSAGHKVSCRNLDLAQLLVLSFTSKALKLSPRVTCSGSISTYPYSLFHIIIVLIIMIPHYFHKQRYIGCPQKYVCVLHVINDGGMQLLLSMTVVLNTQVCRYCKRRVLLLAPLP